VQHVRILSIFLRQFSNPGVYSKRDSAILAQEQSNHLFLCVLVADLTQRYGPVIRQAKVVGVLDAAFDVLVPEFGIEKRVHVDQMPIDVSNMYRWLIIFLQYYIFVEPCLRRPHAYSSDLLVQSRRDQLACREQR
jgi:hypothetical protein